MIQRRWRAIVTGCVLIPILAITGCRSSSIDLVDLNKVLDILVSVLESPTGDTATAVASIGGDSATTVVPLEADNENAAKQKEFVDAFSSKLNAASLVSSPIGVSIDPKGDILGFADSNKNNIKEASDKLLFTIQIDQEGQRLIATDNQGNSRPHRYRFGMGGFLLGTMLGRQNRFYSGARSTMRPDFKSKTMSPQNYHASAVSRARAKASSFGKTSTTSRSRSGTGGFSFGK